MKIPSQIGKYKILEELGRGAAGCVMKAEQSIIRRIVAIKLLFTELMKIKPNAIRRFQREARLACSLVHPNIVPIYEIGEEGGIHYYAMQYVQGTPLMKFMKERELSLEQKLELFIPFCDALALAHSKDIIHRDLKPHNVIIADDLTPIILDFGIAKSLIDNEEGLTQTGNILGSAHYMAPEQASSKAVGTYSDVFAIGVMMYEFLTNERPFKGSNVRDLVLARVEYGKKPESYPLVSMREIDSDIPQKLDQIVFKCLHAFPQERYDDAGKLLADLQKFHRELRLQQGMALSRKRGIEVKRPVAKKSSYVYPALFSLFIFIVGLALTAWIHWGQGKYPLLDRHLYFLKDLKELRLDTLLQYLRSLVSLLK